MKTRMKNIIPHRRVAAITLLVLLTGCVSVKRYTYQDAPKSDMRFESLAAATTFYDALLAKKFPTQQQSKGPHGDVTISLPMPYMQYRQTRTSANVLFNEAATKADANHDGVISEEEARVYAQVKSP